MIRFIFLSLFCLTILSCFGQTQSELDEIAANGYHKAQKELDSVYQKILEKYKKDTAFIKNFKIAQRLWVQLRHAEMRAKYPGRSKNEENYYGSVLPMCWAEYLAHLTMERTKKLKVWLTGIEEGDVCPGSVKIRN